VKNLLLTGVAALFLATGTAHAQDALVTRRGVDWKCRDGVTVRFDQVGEKREEGSSETLTITGLHNFRKLHITCGNRGCPVLNGRRCVIQD
jgi:hypothetical protein